MSRAPLINMALLIAGEGSTPRVLRYHFRTTAAAPAAAGAAKLVPADIPYVTEVSGSTLELHIIPYGAWQSESKPWRVTGPVTREPGATRSGLTRLRGSRTPE
jgi:hypothetical protein